VKCLICQYRKFIDNRQKRTCEILDGIEKWQSYQMSGYAEGDICVRCVLACVLSLRQERLEKLILCSVERDLAQAADVDNIVDRFSLSAGRQSPHCPKLRNCQLKVASKLRPKSTQTSCVACVALDVN